MKGSEDSLTQTLESALSGDASAAEDLCSALARVIQARVFRMLFRFGRHQAANARQEVEDLTQGVLLSLFEHDARRLKTWKLERGLSLANFVGLIAERQVLSWIRVGTRTPRFESLSDGEPFDEEPAGSVEPEPPIHSRQLLAVVWARLREQLSPKGAYLFDELFVRERSIDELTRQTGMSTDAIYAWRSRLTRQARAVRLEIEKEGS